LLFSCVVLFQGLHTSWDVLDFNSTPGIVLVFQYTRGKKPLKKGIHPKQFENSGLSSWDSVGGHVRGCEKWAHKMWMVTASIALRCLPLHSWSGALPVFIVSISWWSCTYNQICLIWQYLRGHAVMYGHVVFCVWSISKSSTNYWLRHQNAWVKKIKWHMICCQLYIKLLPPWLISLHVTGYYMKEEFW